MRKHIHIGIYIGTILLERDLKYQRWLKMGRPMSFLPQANPIQKAK